MKKIRAAWIGTVAVLASSGLLSAHHSLGQFDTTKPVRVKGAVVMFELINPHSIIFVDQTLADGKTQRWAVDGPSTLQLARRGFNVAALKAGAVIEVCGYAPKEGADSKLERARRLNGELLVMPDGGKEIWSDYGQHLCLDANFHDSHK